MVLKSLKTVWSDFFVHEFSAEKGVFFWRTTHDHGEILEFEESVVAPLTTSNIQLFCGTTCQTCRCWLEYIACLVG